VARPWCHSPTKRRGAFLSLVARTLIKHKYKASQVTADLRSGRAAELRGRIANPTRM